ncbi:reverse transcriptase domain-containing protein [Tanacetum coccineum]|uniref:Reverse transcriptase domain-containing protein n=1 Tax=Tanacetum coccineum TaxID=301880 RepID=A0ABQ4WJN4_9ASTR
MDDLEPNDELVDTPLVSPFLYSDNDSDDGEVLNELEEYGNARQLCRQRAINSFDGDDLAFEWSFTYITDFVILEDIGEFILRDMAEERISKKRTKNEAKTTKPDTEWKSMEKVKVKSKPKMLERLAGNEYYCFLDGFSGYFQILIDPLDQEKTTFTCPYGTFAYRRMPFGLCNAPGTFQRCMVAIFHDMIEKPWNPKAFMDDFSVFLWMQTLAPNVTFCQRQAKFRKRDEMHNTLSKLRNSIGMWGIGLYRGTVPSFKKENQLYRGSSIIYVKMG